MKIAVINFSGNVGKTTVARHLILPRIKGAELISVESINADDGQGQALRGRQFGELQEYLKTVDNVVVDIGASNVEELLSLMRKYHGSQDDFDYFFVPTVPALKQQQDTIATLIELSGLGIRPSRLKPVFNMLEDTVEISDAFATLLAFLQENPIAEVLTSRQLRANEIYGRIQGSDARLRDLASDGTDFKALIAQADLIAEKVSLAQRMATKRLGPVNTN